MSPVVRMTWTAVACYLSEQFCRMSVAFVHCFVTACFVYLARQFGQLLLSPFSQSSFCFVIVVYIMTVFLTAELWCLDVTPSGALHSASERKRSGRAEAPG